MSGSSDILSQIKKAQDGDRKTKEQLVADNSGLIWSIAKRFFGRGVDPDDLYQLGCIGFIKAVDGFDDSFGTQFSTYAVPKIAGEIRRFLRDDGAVKVSRTVKEQANAIRIARLNLEQRLNRAPTVSELSLETGMEPEEIAMCETATAPIDSLQRESGEDGFTLEQILSDTQGEERLIELVALKEAVSSLPDREREVISLRYYKGLTQMKTAEVLKISQVQVSRIEKKAVGILRTLLE